jgi:hypothetical protein
MSPVSSVKLTVLTVVAGMMIMVSAPARAHHGGALVGGLIAGAIVGSAIAASKPKHKKYYYYGGPPPVYYPAPVYGPAYCGYPPYPPCY